MKYVTITEEWIKSENKWLVKVIDNNGKLLHTFTEYEENMDNREYQLAEQYNVKETKVLGII